MFSDGHGVEADEEEVAALEGGLGVDEVEDVGVFVLAHEPVAEGDQAVGVGGGEEFAGGGFDGLVVGAGEAVAEGEGEEFVVAGGEGMVLEAAGDFGDLEGVVAGVVGEVAEGAEAEEVGAGGEEAEVFDALGADGGVGGFLGGLGVNEMGVVGDGVGFEDAFGGGEGLGPFIEGEVEAGLASQVRGLLGSADWRVVN